MASHTRFLTVPSIAALSQTLPERLIEQTTPWSAISFWNCSLVYWANSSGRRNGSTGVAMIKWKRRSDRSGRAPLPSPGRPPVGGRNELRRFWAAIASGLSSEDAAARAQIPQAVGARLFRKAGGMPPALFGPLAKPPSGRYLHLPNVRRLRSCGRKAAMYARWRVGSDEQHQRSPGSCGATPPPAVAVWNIARRQRSGMPSDQPVDQNRHGLC